MPEPNFTQLAAQLWKTEGEPAGMSPTAFLSFMRSPEGGGLAIRTQTYYRMVGEMQSLVDTLPAQWGEPLDEAPTFMPLTRTSAEPAYWHHVNIFEWVPSMDSATPYIMVPHHYTVKSMEPMTRREAIAQAENDMKLNQPSYGIEGAFISGGVVTGGWEPVR